MRVNVVTLVNDDLEGIKRTSKSVLKQSIPVYWSVVTPGGSHSEITDYIESLKLKGIVKAIINDEGLGVYPAMNEAIKCCNKNDWIWFLNAGDEFAEISSYATVVSAIEKTKKEWVYGGHFLGSHTGHVIAEISAPKQFMPSNQLFSRKYISHQSTIFSNHFLMRLNGFNTHYKIAADWDLMVRAWRISEGERIPEILSVFYMGGLSTSSRQKGNRELLEIRKIQLSKKYMLKNYCWFIYRAARNYIIQSIENLSPEKADTIRRFCFLARNKIRKKND